MPRGLPPRAGHLRLGPGLVEEQDLEQAIAADNGALTNYDPARLTDSDEVIIAAVRSHGGKFDLSPDGLIRLKALGVSDRVILAVRQSAAPPTFSTVPAVTPAGYQVPAPVISSTPAHKRRPWWRAVPKDGPPSEAKWW